MSKRTSNRRYLLPCAVCRLAVFPVVGGRVRHASSWCRQFRPTPLPERPESCQKSKPAVSPCDMCRFTLPNGTYRKAKRRVLERKTARFATPLIVSQLRRPCALSRECQKTRLAYGLFFNAGFGSGVDNYHYLCIRQAALGKLRTSSLSARLHSLCMVFAALARLASAMRGVCMGGAVLTN